jgi:hypothetical protein
MGCTLTSRSQPLGSTGPLLLSPLHSPSCRLLASQPAAHVASRGTLVLLPIPTVSVRCSLLCADCRLFILSPLSLTHTCSLLFPPSCAYPHILYAHILFTFTHRHTVARVVSLSYSIQVYAALPTFSYTLQIQGALCQNQDKFQTDTPGWGR